MIDTLEKNKYTNVLNTFILCILQIYIYILNPYAALGTFLVFCGLISLTILAVLMQMV